MPRREWRLKEALTTDKVCACFLELRISFETRGGHLVLICEQKQMISFVSYKQI